MLRSLFAVALVVAAVSLTACDTVSAPTGVSPSTSTQTTGGALPFKVGQTYTYAMTTTGVGAAVTSEFKTEVLEVSGGQAKVRNTFTVAGQQTSTEATIGSAAQLGTTAPAAGEPQPQAMGTESVTVGAGTFTCTKYVYEKADDKMAIKATSWVNETVGLVKSVSESEPKAGALPAIPGLPAGGLSLKTTTTLELKSYTK